MQIVLLYGVTALFFLVVDAIMLTKIMSPLFETHLGDQLRDSPRLGAAALFYLFYVVGVLVFVSLPALRADAPMQALWMGAMLGAVAYGTYEFTSFAVMKNWHWQMVVADTTWGAVLTGSSAFVGVWITRALIGPA
ncbi:DUF2177 family protein [Lutimaribacter sp. EGI FJ00015]|uniref:DUF2177 family protein n=1 Tax=Lutimaribacter degradans TaxID=2945989 RepID=A0ACC5ZQJ9_9RHOB|nr:DUF2177 family protein [Lutimaribacter sp. EGI FJ00013]MCM2560552.1 DUF2177 family protein [Lutimaribacter sp. EGI FJ00013]MCO0612505.1 DUF2177 family protein [Lutimaribacter sp. EGI FJ00015]MCO0634376.1 DUF2177 family protein [Lutimaribacter sp. EGI FJ00014]